MPYIKQGARERLDVAMRGIPIGLSSGELHYLITKILVRDVNFFGESYDEFNNLIGILECVKQELYRRRVAPYEDKKMKENGDVYQ